MLSLSLWRHNNEILGKQICTVGSCDQWEISPFIKDHWQSSCTALTTGILQRENVSHFRWSDVIKSKELTTEMDAMGERDMDIICRWTNDICLEDKFRTCGLGWPCENEFTVAGSIICYRHEKTNQQIKTIPTGRQPTSLSFVWFMAVSRCGLSNIK